MGQLSGSVAYDTDPSKPVGELERELGGSEETSMRDVPLSRFAAYRMHANVGSRSPVGVASIRVQDWQCQQRI